MHAELLAARVPGVALAAVCDAAPDAARAVADQLGVDVADVSRTCSRAEDVDAVAICSSTPTHAGLIAARGGRRQGDLLREAGLARPRRGRPRARRGRGAPASVPDRLQPPLRPLQSGGSRRGRRRRDRRAPSRADLEPRPGPAAGVLPRVSGGLFLDMTVHDFDMARYVTGSEVTEVYARGAVRITPSSPSRRRRHRRRQLTHENGCLTVIDNSRQAVYGYDQRVEVFGSGEWSPPRTRTSTVPSCACGRHRLAAMPYFYLERYPPPTSASGRRSSGLAPARRRPSTGDARAARDRPRRGRRSLREAARPVLITEVGG